MELNLTTASGNASKKTVEVSEEAFNKDFNEALVHQVVTAYLAGGRAGPKAQKNRSAVSGGGFGVPRLNGLGSGRLPVASSSNTRSRLRFTLPGARTPMSPSSTPPVANRIV